MVKIVYKLFRAQNSKAYGEPIMEADNYLEIKNYLVKHPELIDVSVHRIQTVE